jgi:type II secretory pathway predicted ATPase ExeA
VQPPTKTTDRLRPHDPHRQTVPGGITAPGLARNELPRYHEHRLRLAGTELALFTPPATEALFQATNGMPRKVNRIAYYALTAAALEELRP